MIPEKNTLNPFALIASIVVLGFLFLVYSIFRPAPTLSETYTYLSNLRGITESGIFYGIEELLSILLLYFWKSLFNLNYLTTLQSLSSIIYSVCLHLILLLFHKKEWKLNHYFLIYFSAFLPFTHEFPMGYFNELLGLLFILLIFLTFKMETIFDLFLFPVLVTLAFIADLKFFLLGFTTFVSITSIQAGQKLKSKTTVFYKKKNIPNIILLAYIFSFIVSLILFSWYNFFSESSFADLLLHWGKIVVHIGPAFLVIATGKILLETERELRTITFTIILAVSTLAVVLWNYKRYDTSLETQLESKKEILVRSLPFIGDTRNIFISPDIANYLFFQTKINMKYVRPIPIPEKSFLFVEDLKQVDANEIINNYISKKGKKQASLDIIPIGDKFTLIGSELEAKLLRESNKNPFRKKVENSRNNLDRLTPYYQFLKWQQRVMGFSHLQ